VANEPGTFCWTDLAAPDMEAAAKLPGRGALRFSVFTDPNGAVFGVFAG
jgi:predicted enzyme related to lactoylglutathione lyase